MAGSGVLRPESKGHRSLVELLDAWADQRPEKVYASILKDADASLGFRDFTTKEVRSAADGFAHWLVNTYGRSHTHETIAYVGLADLRYAVVFFGCVKAGYKALFISPKNPADQNASLAEQLGVRRFLCSSELAPVAYGVREILPSLEVQEVAPFDHWLQTSAPFHFSKTFAETRNDPVLCVHSSGSTGRPKPITMTNSYFAAADSPLRQIPGRKSLSPVTTFDFPGGGFYLSPFPPFHLAGFQTLVMNPCFSFEATPVLLLPDRPPAPQLMYDIMKVRHIKLLYSPPSLIEAVSQFPDGLDVLSRSESVVYAGGPLSNACGDVLARRLALGAVYGSSETCGAQLLDSPPEAWDYLAFHPDYGARFEPAIDGSYELVFHQDDPYPELRGINFTFPNEKIWRTKDTFLPHPTIPDLWKFHGRNDDIIVFSNGSKYNPIPAENTILAAPQISGVLIVGDGRVQTCAIVEPKATPDDAEAFVSSLWPYIEKANVASQRQGQLQRRMIEVVEPGGLVRAPKGTVVRSFTRDKYKKNIERLYEDNLDAAAASVPAFIAPTSLHSALLGFVGQCARSLKQLTDISDTEDLYVRGLDSIQTIELSRMLRIGLRRQYGDLTWLNGQLVFAHSSVEKLAAVIERAVNQNSVQAANPNDQPVSDHASHIEALIAKYTSKLPALNSRKAEVISTGLTVLLTGSTGTLGLRLLEEFQASSSITSVVCLDRDANAKARFSVAMPSLAKDMGKVTFLQAHLGETSLGLSSKEYTSLLETVDIIVHNAWKVDFNHSLPSFEPVHIAGLTNLLTFTAISSRRVSIGFVSSISTVSNWNKVPANRGNTVSEDVPKDVEIVADMGYGQSKYVSERILDAAASKYSGQVPITILRAGQIAGPVRNGDGPAWNRGEWFPALLRTSKALGCLPSQLTDLDWLPVNTVAAISSELVLDSHVAAAASTARVANVVNPRVTKWEEVMHAVKRELGVTHLVPLAEWLAKLESLDAGDNKYLEAYPALKIVPFYKGLAQQLTDRNLVFSTATGQNASQTMRSVPAVNEQWLQAWIQQLAL